MHGLGNDFVIMNFMLGEPNRDWAEEARQICDRRFGIGADGLVLLLPSDVADLRMMIMNPDGSEAEMCGNAIRCVAKYVYEKGLIDDISITVETGAGVLVPELVWGDLADDTDFKVRVDMGKPVLAPVDIPVAVEGDRAIARELTLDGKAITYSAVSMGNPHCVVFVPDLESVDYYRLGPALEQHPLFPKKTNVEFVQVVNPSELKVRVWERGAGETLACGTGACAVAVAGVLNQYSDRRVKVVLPGGSLDIEWAEDGRLFMTGPAENVFEGNWLRWQVKY
ncbi:MAG: diaminopimelate epimerase [Firmicutes bacterium]|nr:diaminopimelate epimerase [Bacillota bacterium]